MLTFRKTDHTDKDFQQLVTKLDAELRIRDGDDHLFYAALNKTHNIKYVIVAYENDLPVGCGSIREFSAGIMEVKRMYVELEQRGKGIATAILQQLELWALELGYSKLVLETGRNQPEAIALYGKNNYQLIPNFGKYQNVYNSVCFEKILAKL